MLSTSQSQSFGITAKLLLPFVGVHVLTVAALGALLFRSAAPMSALLMAAGVGVGAMACGIAAYVAISRRMKKQADSLAEALSLIFAGNPDRRAEVLTGDELGQLAANLNQTLDGSRNLLHSKKELDRMQAAITKLLDEMAGLAQGDLSVRAEAKPGRVGAIADTFNYVTDQLRTIISRVQDVSATVSSTADQTHKTAESLAQDSENQARQILGAREALEEMAQSMQQVSESATRSAEVAQQSLANARQGAESVQNTMRGLRRIREQVQEAAKRIKRLEQSAEEISEIVQLIDEIADRTGILAVNASIQAQAAGKAGRGFAVVAEEVEQLAERSTEATKRIASLVKTVQLSTSEAIAAMEESTREIVEGSNLVTQTGQALNEIETISNRLAELNRSISMVASHQANSSQAVFRSIAELSEFTMNTAIGIKKSAASAQDLAALADQLKASVASFKLPYATSNGGHAGHTGSLVH